MYMFPSKVGVPAVVQDPAATPTTFSAAMTGWSGGGLNSCVVTGITGSTQGNYQFLLTLRNYTYVYVFGEKMGEFTVQGLTMGGTCWNGMEGMTNAITYYNMHCISNTGQPIALMMAGYATYGFLVGAQFTYTDPEHRIGQFVYKFQTITDPSG